MFNKELNNSLSPSSSLLDSALEQVTHHVIAKDQKLEGMTQRFSALQQNTASFSSNARILPIDLQSLSDTLANLYQDAIEIQNQIKALESIQLTTKDTKNEPEKEQKGFRLLHQLIEKKREIATCKTMLLSHINGVFGTNPAISDDEKAFCQELIELHRQYEDEKDEIAVLATNLDQQIALIELQKQKINTTSKNPSTKALSLPPYSSLNCKSLLEQKEKEKKGEAGSVRDLVCRFTATTQTEGVNFLRGLIGTFVSPFSEGIAKTIGGIATYKREAVAAIVDLEGLYQKALDQDQALERKEEDLKALQNETFKEKAAFLHAQLDLEKEQLTLIQTFGDILSLKCFLLTKISGFFSQEGTSTTEELILKNDANALFAQFVVEKKEMEKQRENAKERIEAIKHQITENKYLKWFSSCNPLAMDPLAIVDTTAADLLIAKDLAEHPWKKRGAMQFLIKQLNLHSGQQKKDVQLGMMEIQKILDVQLEGMPLTADHLNAVIMALEAEVKQKQGNDSQLTFAVVYLKKLVADAALSHPDEVRRALSLAIFLFTYSISGGGSVVATCAKVVCDGMIKSLLPTTPKSGVQQTTGMISRILTGLEVAACFWVGGIKNSMTLSHLISAMPAIAGYCAAEVAHQKVPDQYKPYLVGASAFVGFSSIMGASNAIIPSALVTLAPLSTVQKIKSLVQLIGLYRDPKQIPALLAKKGFEYLDKINTAIKAQAWTEATVRIAAIAIPAILLAVTISLTFAHFSLLALAIGLTWTQLSALGAFLAVLYFDEKNEKENVVVLLQKWQKDYENKIGDANKRDLGVMKIFQEMEERIRTNKELTENVIFSLIKKHIPTFKNLDVKELKDIYQTLRQPQVPPVA